MMRLRLAGVQGVMRFFEKETNNCQRRKYGYHP